MIAHTPVACLLNRSRSVLPIDTGTERASPPRLLAEGELAPCVILNENAASPFVLTCDHAGNQIPKSLGSLGLPDHELGTMRAAILASVGIACRPIAKAEMAEQPGK